MDDEIKQEKPEIENIELRLLGYYNDPGQSMDDEAEEPERAAQLAELMSQTFDMLDDPNDDPLFKNAVNNGVFILKDQESRLYAYFHRERKARVNGVYFNRTNLAQLPQVYKYWFKPGEKLNIAPLGTANIQNTSFFDYLRQPDRVGKQVVLATDYLPSKGVISGELVAVGRDFLSITDTQGQTYVISNHMCVQLNLPLLQKPKENVPLLQQEVSAMGYIRSYDEKKGQGWVVTNDGEQLGFAGTSLLDSKLREGSQVVFTRYPEQGFVKGKHIAFANFVHSPGSVDDIFRLALQLRRQKKPNETIEVLKHILDEYPDHAEANAMLQELSNKDTSQGKQPELDPDTVEFNRANEIVNSEGDKVEAIKIYESLLLKEKKIKDCIMRIASTYQALYEEAKDQEEKDLYRRKLLDHISQYHTKLSPAASLTFRLQNYMKLRDDELYLGLVDSQLGETEINIDNAKRGKMLYFKALYMSQSESPIDKDYASELAEESLFLNPFNNKAELLWQPAKEYIGETPTVPTGRSRYAQALLRKGTVKDDEGNIDWMERLNRTDKYSTQTNEGDVLKAKDDLKLDYAILLLNAAKSGRAVNSNNQDITDMVLAEYMSYKARELAMKGEMDSAIYLWSELFAIVPGMGYFAQSNLSAMMSAVLSKGIGNITNNVYVPWQEVLSNAKDITPQQWEQMLYAVSTNPEILKAVDQHLMDNAQLAAAWEAYSNTTGNEGTLQEAIVDIPRKGFEESAASKVGELHKNIPDLIDKLKALSAADFSHTPFIQLTAIEQNWLSKVTDECRPLINQYLVTDNVKEKLQKGNEIKKVLASIANSVISTPTFFSINGLLPLINSITANIDRVADTSTDFIKPQLTLTITSEYVSKGNDGYYHIVGKIENNEDAGDAENLRLTISKGNFTAFKKQTVSIANLYGGMKAEFFFDVKLKSTVEQKDSFGFSITCVYHYKNEEYTQVFNPLQCRIGLPPVFNKIEKNPYTYGTAIAPSDPTFKGRTDDIEEIVNFVMHPQRPSAQIIVYGQKRCGKSTLMGAVKSYLEEKYANQAFCVYFTLSPEKNNGEIMYSEADFFYVLLSNIEDAVYSAKDPCRPEIDIPSKEDLVASATPAQLFSDTIIAFKRSMAATPGWEHRRLVVIIDEFTRLYTCIKEKWASDSILHNWKAIQEASSQAKFATIFVGHDITPKFFDEDYARNTTAIIVQKRITYLDKNAARELIEKPIWDEVNKQSRFTAEAIKRIIYWTACNPSYLQLFMMRMVKYINTNELFKVSVEDVDIIAKGFITKEYEEFANIGKFDNLINSGLSDVFCEIKDSHFITVLRIIAQLTKDTSFCQRIDVEEKVLRLSADEDNTFILDHLNEILYDLDVRNVIERKEKNEEIRIIIALFKEWLIRN